MKIPVNKKDLSAEKTDQPQDFSFSQLGFLDTASRTNLSISEISFVEKVAAALNAVMKHSADIEAIYWPPQSTGEQTSILPVTLGYKLRIKGFTDLGVYSVSIYMNINFMDCPYSERLGAFKWDADSHAYIWSDAQLPMRLRDFEGKAIDVNNESPKELVAIHALTMESFNEKVFELSQQGIDESDQILFLRSVLHEYNVFQAAERERDDMVKQAISANQA